jgi:hypothetical protein
VREKYAVIGPKWVEISKYLVGRSGNDVKNRWHKHLAKWEVTQMLPSLPPFGQPLIPLCGTLPVMSERKSQTEGQMAERSLIPFRNTIF